MSYPVPTDRSLYVGLMSGTSADGIDAALVDFADPVRPRLVAARTLPWPERLRERLVVLGQADVALALDEVGELDARIAAGFADAVADLLDHAGVGADQVAAIGSHGQTLRHRPLGRAGDGRDPFTLQLGDPSLLAERSGIAVVADFRRRDVAAGGHGAPLLPALHAALLAHPEENRAVLNLGGIGNLTLLPAGGSGPVQGFDTGPANALMDAWCRRHTGQGYDRAGAFAAGGRVDAALLEALLAEPFFAQPPPRSTGRDQFHLGWVDARLSGSETPADVQATLLALTVRTIADALQAAQPDTARVIACGGGVHNPVLMDALATALPRGCVLETTAAHGLDPDFVEAMGFAWLARRTAHGLAGNLPTVTGAGGDRILGGIYPS